MATLQQIGDALKRAAAAGDTAAATKLAQAYKAMQAQGGSGPVVGQPGPGGPPGSRAYADWAAQQARAGKALPMIEGSGIPTTQQQFGAAAEAVRQADFPDQPADAFRTKAATELPPLNPQEIAQNDQLFGFGDELAGLAGGVNQMLRGKDFGQSAAAWQKMQEARRALGLEQGGPLATGASVLGNLTSLGAAAPAAAAGPVPGFVKTALTGGTTGAVMGGIQGFGSTDGDLGQRLQGAQSGATAGAVVGAAAPTVLRAVTAPFQKAAQTAVVNNAIKNAPSAADLSSAASQMFNSAKSSGIGVAPQRFGQLVHNLASDAVAKDIDKELDGPAWTVYDRLVQLSKDGFNDPSALTLSRLHNLRQKAQDVVFDSASKGRTKKFAQDIIDGLDGMIASLKPGDITGPTNLLGNGKSAANSLLDGISTWSKAKKVGLVESAMNNAENYPSGLESGLRAQFKSLLNNSKTKNLWTPVERQAMQEVINGNMTVKALRTLGIFRGFASAGVGGALGSAFGPIGSAAGTALGGAAGLAARKVTEMAAAKSAGRAAQIVATPNIPTIQQLRLPPSTLLPLLPSDHQRR